MSQIITFRNRQTGVPLYATHHFVSPHGRILASGFPDPKIFFEATETLLADPAHPDDPAYTCGRECSAYRTRAVQAQAALEEYQLTCDICTA